MILPPERRLCQVTSQRPYQAYFRDSCSRSAIQARWDMGMPMWCHRTESLCFLELNWSNTDVRNETKAVLKGDWHDCSINHPNNRKCQNSDWLSIFWSKLLLLHCHHRPRFITWIAFPSLLLSFWKDNDPLSAKTSSPTRVEKLLPCSIKY